MELGRDKVEEYDKVESGEKKIVLQERQYQSLLLLIKKFQSRIQEMESSKFWKLKILYHKVQAFFKTSGNSSKKNRTLFGKIIYLFTSRGRKSIRKLLLIIFKNLYLWLEENPPSIIISSNTPYESWMIKNSPRQSDLEEYKNNLTLFQYQPLISIIVPVYNTPIPYLQKMLESVQQQVYPNWELCIADDCSSNATLKNELAKYPLLDNRIKLIFREQNGHISVCSNSALSLVNGEFTGFLDHDDLLAPEALYEVVHLLNKNKEADFIYSDEDKVDESGRLSDPHFKPDWCPENLLSRNYISHFSVIRSTLIKEVGGFREGFEGSQDYDLYLRITEITSQIYHIPKILYHWRMHKDSVALNESAKHYAFESGIKALEEALIRRGEEGRVTLQNGLPGFYNVRFKLQDQKRVSIIIATKDKADVLEKCLDSIYQKSSYKNLEIILIDNNSTEKKLETLLQKYTSQYPDNFYTYRYDVPFNFSLLMNFAVSKTTGDYFLFLNNDTEVITPDWIECLMEQAQREKIGFVGAKLLFPNDTVQHAGVVIGLGGVAGHSFIGKHKDDFGYFYYLTSINNYSALTGACFMCRKEVFIQAGGFDENYEVEYNDTDLCLRIKDLGFRNVFIPHAILYHHESLSRGNPLATEKSIIRHKYEINRFKNRWNNYITHDPCYSQHLSLDYTDFRLRV
jgi:glycosyltransferase involved in cell wall biosynthesis